MQATIFLLFVAHMFVFTEALTEFMGKTLQIISHSKVIHSDNSIVLRLYISLAITISLSTFKFIRAFEIAGDVSEHFGRRFVIL